MNDVEFRVLGPLEVLVEGRALELKRRKQRSLLALLLLNAGEVVSTDRLVEDLWAGNPPKAAVGSLQNLVSELRKIVGRDAVRTREPGYVLDVDPERIDLHRFERLVAQAAEGGDPKRRSALLREGLALWRGDPLADLTYEPFAHVEVARLEELRTAAREELADAELELGHHTQIVGELETLVAEHPLRERLRGQLMLALYRSGRQAEALDAYRQARDTLVEELGIEPSPELQRLEQSVLRHDEELDLPERGAMPEPRAEERRKTVTILFADIVDSTSLNAALDPEVLRSIMRRYFDIVRTVVERHGGTIEKFIGDAAMAVFGVPHMHEDDALRAVRAADELREALVGLNDELERAHGLLLEIRTGINTGEVLTGDAAAGQPFATGAAVTVAMRLQQAALPSETLLGEVTHSVLRAAVRSEPVEPIDAGALGHIRAFRLLDVGESAGLRPPTGSPFVGRGRELDTLRAAFESTRDERRSRVVVVLGEAGIGKTRLANELIASIGEEAQSLIGRCVSYGEGATYLPLAEIVGQIAPERPQATIASLIEGDDDAPLVAERVAELTGRAEGTAPTGELFWAVRRLFDALGRRRPLVIVFEDLHWAEPTLLDLVEYLAAWTVDAPLLVVCLARPELQEERPGLGAEAGVLSLEPLPAADTDRLVGELASVDVAPDTRSRIADIAEGNPLFVEQLLAFLVEAGPNALASVPPSVEALLASRLDRLDPQERATLERAAVAGREFARAAVVHLTPPDEVAGADRRLRALARRGLIHVVRSALERGDAFRFHHVLIRDVAYAGLTKDLRGDLHERFARWLEQREEGAEEIVGYHLEQAYRYRAELRPDDPDLSELAQRAGERLGAAGIRAWKRADTPAAVNLLGRATSLLPAGEPSRAELLCELGVALRWAEDLDQAQAAFEGAVSEASRAHDRRIELRATLEANYAGLLVGGDQSLSEFLDLATQAIPVFEELEDARALARTWRHIGFVRGGLQSRHAEWEAAAERALVYYERSGWSSSGCIAELAASLYLGPTTVSAGIERYRELLDRTSERVGRAHVLAFLGGLEALGGRIDVGRALVSEAAEIYDELDETYARAYNSARIMGRIECLGEDFNAAATILYDCCDVFERAHDQAARSSSSSELAQALYAAGRTEEARQATRAAELCASREDVTAQFGWRAIAAKLLAQQGAFEDAEALAREAVALSESTDSPCQRGDVLVDLAEVQRLAGRRLEAARTIERALALFVQKGNVISSRKMRNFLAELSLAET
ncbi:MAG TPA: BTAD domain-containing putative transcriptional regulator [Gaiellaceae bacterium]|nr:BTAD domain-containing putative transcriptional regulator [Gaiellaceae bacterium]